MPEQDRVIEIINKVVSPGIEADHSLITRASFIDQELSIGIPNSVVNLLAQVALHVLQNPTSQDEEDQENRSFEISLAAVLLSDKGSKVQQQVRERLGQLAIDPAFSDSLGPRDIIVSRYDRLVQRANMLLSHGA